MVSCVEDHIVSFLRHSVTSDLTISSLLLAFYSCPSPINVYPAQPEHRALGDLDSFTCGPGSSRSRPLSRHPIALSPSFMARESWRMRMASTSTSALVSVSKSIGWSLHNPSPCNWLNLIDDPFQSLPKILGATCPIKSACPRLVARITYRQERTNITH